MLRILLFLVSLGLVIYTVVDVLQQQDDKPYGLHRVLWVVLMVFFPPIGSLVWLAMRYVKGTSPAPPRSAAPDDDPDYLRWLAERQRRRREEEGKDKPQD